MKKYLELHINGVMRERLSLDFVAKGPVEFSALVKHQVEGLKESYRVAIRGSNHWEIFLVIKGE